jgi:tetratricopeptide (TPR) repeat protein
MLVLSFLLFGTILFTMNPLFSMPMDWDLFCFPVPILLLLLLLLVAQQEKETIALKIPVVSGGLMLLCIPAFSVFLTLEQNSYRAERVGVHIYKTYYEHASTYLLMSVKMIKGNDQYRERMNGLIQELEPHALPGNDQQYAELLVDKAYFDYYIENNPEEARKSLLKSMEYQRLESRFDQLAFDINRSLVQQRYTYSQEDKKRANAIVEKGKVLLREKKEYAKAYHEFRYSRYYDPLNGRAILLSIEALFRMKRYAEAHEFAVDLVALKYPDPKTALRIGIHTALEANKYGEALRYCTIFLENFDPEETIVTVKERLDQRDRVEELKFLFNRGE